MTTKVCERCNRTLELLYFGCDNSREDKLNTCCLECRRTEARAFYSSNSARAMLLGAKRRAKSTGIPFNIDESDIIVPSRCPLLGIKLAVSTTKAQASSPSLDRIVPHKGYVKGNIMVISNRANRIKCDATFEEFELILTNWRKLL